jgi:hypothetical protein
MIREKEQPSHRRDDRGDDHTDPQEIAQQLIDSVVGPSRALVR